MKSPLLHLLAFAVTSTLAFAKSEPIPRLRLHNGDVYENARILSIRGDNVAISHSGGLTNVPAQFVDLEVLARAKMEIDARKPEEQAAMEAARKRAAEQLAISDAAEKQEIAIRLAEANARERAAGRKQQPIPRGVANAVRRPSAAELKARFPAKTVGHARVFIPRSGQGGRPYVMSSTFTEIQGGPSIASSRVRSVANGRIDSIQYDAPSDDMWRWYRGMFQTTTIEALPRTLKMVEERIAEDTRKCQAQAGGLSASGQAQGQHTLQWFQTELRPYIAEWRKLLR